MHALTLISSDNVGSSSDGLALKTCSFLNTTFKTDPPEPSSDICALVILIGSGTPLFNFTAPKTV